MVKKNVIDDIISDIDLRSWKKDGNTIVSPISEYRPAQKTFKSQIAT
jgi:hypothetical protein